MSDELRLTRVRLVNFHNFVDETIELRDGGHLFLLGDNGSGKTTVLDAVHYVLSGGEGIELNAAARLGGRRDEGRTIQGVCLRFDPERGVRNQDGAIAYAALELAREGGGQICLAVGVEATTMEARVSRWGVVTRRSLEDVPLVIDTGAGEAPCPRELLRERLGKSDVYFQLAEYRREVARRLFGGEASYREVCRFWSMAKAYREIVAGAGDLSALFRRLLPAPDGETFGEILRSLRAIDEIEVALGGIGEQRAYVAGLLEVADEIGERRLAAARYRWLLAHRELEEERAREATAAARAEALGGEIAAAERERTAAELALGRAQEALRLAQAGEKAERIAALRRTEERAAELAIDHDRATAAAAEKRAAAAAAEREANAAGEELARALGEAAGRIERAAAEASELPGGTPGVRALVSDLRGGGEPRWRALEAALGEAAGGLAAARQALSDAEAARARAGEETARLAAEGAALAAEADDAPAIPHLAAAIGALARAGIAAAPLCACLEPAAGAAPEAVADLEALAGEETLGALVVDAGREREAFEVSVAAAPEARVVLEAGGARLPAWAESIIGAAAGARGETARAALAAALSQPVDLGEVRASAAGGDLALRGVGFRAGWREPRFLGAGARRAWRAERLAAAELDLEAARAEERAASGRAAMAQAAVERAEALAQAVDGACPRGVVALEASAAEIARRARFLASDAAGLEEAAGVAGGRLELARAEVAGLAAAAGGAGAAELAARLARLGEAEREARERLDRRQRDAFRLEEERARARREAAESAGRATLLAQARAAAAAALRDTTPALVGADDEAIAHHVRVVQRGDSFRSTEAVRERIAEAERRELALATELGADGSRGVRYLLFAAQFGFRYESRANQILDRRDQPAAGILAELDRTLAEQRELSGEKTRDLMERLVMGSLARDLQAQVESLGRMVRDINRLLAGLRFGPTEYQLSVTPHADRRELVELVRSISLLDEESRAAFRAWIDDRLPELRGADDGTVPEILDYRTWFEVRIRMRSAGADGVELTRSLRVLGSGGEQAVPNYLLVFALGKLLLDAAGAGLRLLLFDEAFYGIDAGRRDQLLRFATECGLQIVVASPDQDGATAAARQATTLFVVKDEAGDVHLFPYHYWTAVEAQPSLLDPPPAGPDPDATCRA